VCPGVRASFPTAALVQLSGESKAGEPGKLPRLPGDFPLGSPVLSSPPVR
jgi:hypothetical protein